MLSWSDVAWKRLSFITHQVGEALVAMGAIDARYRRNQDQQVMN